MQTIKIHTTQNIDIDYEIAGLGERILAKLIDYVVFIPLWIIGFVVAVNGINDVGIGLYFIIVFVLFVFYDLVCEQFLNGQSIGKRVMKIKVISLNGNRATFGQYLLRWLLRLVDFTLTAYLGALIAAIVTENGQRIGDIAAGTVMVRTEPRTKIDNLVFKPSDDTYVPVFKEVGQITDNDIALIAEVIQNYTKTGNSVLVYNMAQRIKDHLGVVPPREMNDMLFLKTIVKDYSHISAQTESL
ncbi:RDD family protein [Mucilaginibacter sp. SP1R1]|uniref:RDD family protein n=1 Tax=Mucilaginibacter sp. SP1R1 TaxID=2723091 RepID=UPI001612306C|nr:RDD family protein [Mucilaginibacter sp. SP1R1]MBB6151244.1 putative RDD family membrane protein YckC [Mucilaginibacter sp. SP1R1]